MRITDIHKNQPIYVIGGGSSLSGFDFSKLDGKITLACNSAAFQFPAKYLVFLDDQFYRENTEKVNQFTGIKITLDYPSINLSNIIKVKLWKGEEEQKELVGTSRLTALGITEKEEDGISTGGNSGFLALSLAYIMGGNPIYLLGIDMQFTSNIKYFYEHDISRRGMESEYKHMLQAFNYAAPILESRGVKVCNCSKDSKLEGYEYFSLDDIK